MWCDMFSLYCPYTDRVGHGQDELYLGQVMVSGRTVLYLLLVLPPWVRKVWGCAPKSSMPARWDEAGCLGVYVFYLEVATAGFVAEREAYRVLMLK